MGPLVQEDLAVPVLELEPLDLRRDVEEALGTQEEAPGAAPTRRLTVRCSCSRDSDGRAANEKFRVPPSGLNPNAIASASIRVDLPVPLSPTRNVTGAVNSSVDSERIAGMQNGNSSGFVTVSHRSSIPRTASGRRGTARTVPGPRLAMRRSGGLAAAGIACHHPRDRGDVTRRSIMQRTRGAHEDRGR